MASELEKNQKLILKFEFLAEEEVTESNAAYSSSNMGGLRVGYWI